VEGGSWGNARCRRVIALTVALTVGVTRVAQAAGLADAAQRRAMLRTSDVGLLNHAPAGYVKWAVVSTKGPYARRHCGRQAQVLT